MGPMWEQCSSFFPVLHLLSLSLPRSCLAPSTPLPFAPWSCLLTRTDAGDIVCAPLVILFPHLSSSHPNLLSLKFLFCPLRLSPTFPLLSFLYKILSMLHVFWGVQRRTWGETLNFDVNCSHEKSLEILLHHIHLANVD